MKRLSLLIEVTFASDQNSDYFLVLNHLEHLFPSFHSRWECDSLNEMSPPYSPRHLNFQSPAGDTVWRGLGVVPEGRDLGLKACAFLGEPRLRMLVQDVSSLLLLQPTMFCLFHCFPTVAAMVLEL